ncbi:MAG: chromosome segregation protein SMC [Clostridia bacterium]|nr:chromosome segregation protein SMC [Clostridia bacterium]
MKLKRLDIYGFKSFAERTEVVFNGGITAIVGPNGSGKSNIGDAVKWVLGEQNPRELRGGSMQDVIFNGTEKRKKMAYAEVTLTFDNEDGELKSKYAEVAVTRRLYRNGESEYSLNRQPCRLKDIKELFFDTGIGKDGYSNIGQGRIDDILSSRSEDRREVFEEAAGISMFRSRKEDAERKLNRTLENLARVRDLLSELESRIGPLSEQAESTRQYQKLSERLKTLEMNIFLLKQDKLKARMRTLHETCEEIQDSLLRTESGLQQNSLERERNDEAVRELDDRIGRTRGQSRALAEELHRTEAARDRSCQQRENLENEIARLQTEAEERRSHLQELDQLSARGDQQDDSLGRALDAARVEVQRAETEADEAALRADEAEEALDRHKADILKAVNDLNAVRNTRTQKETMCTQMEEYLTRLHENENELCSQEKVLSQQHEEALALQQKALTELDEIRTEAQKLESDVRALAAEYQEKERRIQQLAMEMQSARGRLKTLSELERDMEGYANAVKRTLQYARNDPGVCGVVAKLIQVPRELEIALDAVMGGSLQYIVTEDDVTAKRMIEYLKQSQAGRATFLPLNTVRPYHLNAEESRVLSMPGCLGVASEMISFENRFRPVMENLLGRTVIARDLDAALPIMRAGHYAFRLVTLDGQVMNAGGSMTGGSTRGKAAGFLSREREIAELEALLRQQEQELEALKESLGDMQSRQAEAKRLRNEAMEAMHQQEIAVAREQEHVFNAVAETQAQAQRLEKTRAAILQLTESLSEIRQDLAALDQGSQEARIDQEALDRKTEELQNDLRQARVQAESLRERVTQLKLLLAEKEHNIQTLHRDKARWTEERERLLKMLDLLDDTIRRSEEKREELFREKEGLETEVRNQASACENAETEVEKLEKNRQELLESQRELIRKSEEMHERHTRDGDQLHHTQLLYSKAESELAALSEHMWNTYEATLATAEEYRMADGEFYLTSGEKEANDLRRQIRELGPINAHAIEEYAQTRERFDDMSRQKEDMEKAEADLRGLIHRLLGQMERQFVAEFEKLNDYFQETFVRLFGGGQAKLILTDPQDPLSCGIEVEAQPPGKKLQLISLLSGGEKALTAIAILFAMLKVKPTPFCILDEIEAALDDANIVYFADYLAEFAQTTQFVVITHRKGTMERCNALYGVAMEEKGVSRMVSVNLENYRE